MFQTHTAHTHTVKKDYLKMPLLKLGELGEKLHTFSRALTLENIYIH